MWIMSWSSSTGTAWGRCNPGCLGFCLCNFTELAPWRAFLGLSEGPVISRRGESDGRRVVLKLTQKWVCWSGVSFWLGMSEKPKPDSSAWQSQQKSGRTKRSTWGALPEGWCLSCCAPVSVGHCGESLSSCKSKLLGLWVNRSFISCDADMFCCDETHSKKENEWGFLKCRPLNAFFFYRKIIDFQCVILNMC